uniref:AAA+ ATPase domain-containing protein n=1 Tax=Oryza glumipatula TaxID=40148 RepID=A0A0D9Z526_9ORYZ
MEADMDMPDPEELEWMESHGLLPEEEEEYAYFDDPEDEGFLPAAAGADQPRRSPQETTAAPAKPADEVSEGNLKRPPPPPPPEQGEERSKRRNVDREDSGDGDEDWLRYSPPPVVEVVAEKTISRFASDIRGDCMSVTAPNGERVYAKVATDGLDGGGIGGTRQRTRISKPNFNYKGLLSESFHSLTSRAEQEALAKALQESAETQNLESCPVTPLVTEQLWVEKYSPNSFTELLSDEHTNREVLLWLKQWDSCVFGSHVRATGDDVLSALRRHSSAIQKNSSNRNFFSKSKGGPGMSQDNMLQNAHGSNSEDLTSSFNKRPTTDNAPEQKVLLLCGPPGLGKTTLAHVAAKHCGYHVVEINASDDRSASSIEPKILDVIQMNSIMSDSKPKCLVIDEIDGALGDGKGAVEINAEKNNSSNSSTSAEDTQVRKSSKKGHKIPKLMRPVICICNDLYAPALRQLRQVAKVHMFVQPTISRVVNRLKYICKKERFKTSPIALSALAEYTGMVSFAPFTIVRSSAYTVVTSNLSNRKIRFHKEKIDLYIAQSMPSFILLNMRRLIEQSLPAECDIRSCLNTLQFLNKKREALNISGFDSQVIGRKDMSKSIIDVWKQVLQKKKLKRIEKVDSNFSRGKDIDSLFSLISNRGDYDVTMDGIHENFLKLNYHDPMLQKTPPVAITISQLVAQVEKPNIEWPKSLQRCRTMLLEKKDKLKTWQNQMSPLISRHLSVESFVEDIASPFLHIISPSSLRPVALNLLSEREKDELVQLVDTMVSYSITYRNTKLEPQERISGSMVSPDVPSLSLDPAINDIINFKGYQSEHIGLSLAMKQVLVHEVEKQKIMKDSAGKLLNQANEGDKRNEVSVSEKKSALVSTKSTSKSNPTTLKMQLSSASSMSGKDPAPAKKHSNHGINFFDRFRKERPVDAKARNDAGQQVATTLRDSRPLIFKYNEGFTNAVKRPVKFYKRQTP